MKCQVNNQERNLPDFLIVGTAKAGTSSLQYYLTNHPEIVLPGKTKETLFFHITTNTNKAQLRYLKKAILDYEEYLDQFANTKKNQICGEICPSYLYFYKDTIANLKRLHPRWREVKIIIILREPVEKVISHYHFVTNSLKIQDKSLEEALRLENDRKKRDDVLLDLLYIDNTSYYKQVEAYMETFSNVGVFFYEDLRKDRQVFLKEILSFLEVDVTYTPENLDLVYNQSSRRLLPSSNSQEWILKNIKAIVPSSIKKRISSSVKKKTERIFLKEETVSLKTRQKLKAHFTPEVKKLEKLIGKDLSFWGY